MARLKQHYAAPHFFGVGIFNPLHDENIGTLWRSAYILGASFIFTVGRKYKPQGGDVVQAWTKIPLYYYQDFEDLRAHLPHATRLVGVELDESAVPLAEYSHPERCVYLLGSERDGLAPSVLSACHEKIALPGHFSLNVSVTGSIVLYDRLRQWPSALPQ